MAISYIDTSILVAALDEKDRSHDKARAILEEEAEIFLRWLKSLETVPLIRSIQTQMEAIRREELAKAEKYLLRGLDEKQRAAVERFSRALMKRFMHPALKTLKSLPADMEGDLLMGSASRLFGLESDSVTLSEHARKGTDEQPLR